MASTVVRFTLPTARSMYLRNVGAFVAGVLDVDANDLERVSRARFLSQPYGATEVGIVDSATPPPALPAVPGPPAADPYPQYPTMDEIVASPALRAAFVPSDWLPINVKSYGAVGDGTTDDAAAIQSALDAVPANGGGVFFPAGIYRVTTTLTSSRRGLLLVGAGGLAYNENDMQSSGSTLLGDAGVPIFAFNGSATSLVHQGPAIERLNFRENGAPKTAAYLVKIGAANRWSVRDCSFNGGAVGLSVDAGNPALDVSWAAVDHCIFRANTIGLDFPNGTGTNVVTGGDFGSTTGIRILPRGSLSAELTVLGAKFDANTVGIHTKGRNMRVYGSGFERCATGILIERDAALHSDSGEHNKILDCIFTGVGTGTGVSIGTGSAFTTVIAEYINLATKVADLGTGTIRVDDATGIKIDRAVNNPFYAMAVANADVSDFWTDSASAMAWRMRVSGGKLRARLGGTSATDEFDVQDSAGTNLLRVFGNGNIQQVSTAGKFEIDGALDHDGSTVGFYGATPVAKATSPGTATGTDAAVINAVVTALRNLGLVT